MSQQTDNKDEHSIALELEPMIESRSIQPNLAQRNRRGLDVSNRDAEMVPKAKSEFDEDEDDIENDVNENFPPRFNPGIDDGFITTDSNGGGGGGGGGVINTDINGKPPRPRTNSVNPFVPPESGLNPNNVNVTGTGVLPERPDLNLYQQKKTLAQGMMDLALLSANANQLRYVLESYKRHPYYYPSLIFISISIIFQVAVGVGLILNSRYDVKHYKDMCRANKINNFTVIGIFAVTVVNVFISAFGVANAENTNG